MQNISFAQPQARNTPRFGGPQENAELAADYGPLSAEEVLGKLEESSILKKDMIAVQGGPHAQWRLPQWLILRRVMLEDALVKKLADKNGETVKPVLEKLAQCPLYSPDKNIFVQQAIQEAQARS